MERIYNKLALYWSKNECAKTDNVFSPISEVCDGTVSLSKSYTSSIIIPGRAILEVMILRIGLAAGLYFPVLPSR